MEVVEAFLHLKLNHCIALGSVVLYYFPYISVQFAIVACYQKHILSTGSNEGIVHL